MAIQAYANFLRNSRSLEADLLEWSKGRPEGRFVHSSNGSEVIPFVVTSVFGIECKYALYYRWHAWALGIGLASSEIYDLITNCRSRDCYWGPMHQRPHPSIVDCNPIVGAHVPIALGAALAEPNKQVICSLGDGALTTGVVHESLNIASLYRPNILFVIEDNARAISVNQGSYLSFSPVDLARMYNLPCLSIDVSNSTNAISRITRWLKANLNGPRLLHAKYIATATHCNAMEG